MAATCGAVYDGNKRGGKNAGRGLLPDRNRHFLLAFWPIRNDQQHAHGANPVHGSTERFQSRGIDPMSILENHQDRTRPRQCFHLGRESFQRFLPSLLPCQFDCGIASIIPQRQHLSKERRVLDLREALC